MEELSGVLWAYHTTNRIPTGETPFSLAYGSEAVILVEIGMPSFRTEHYDPTKNEGELRLNLDLLEEKREQAQLRLATYQQRIARYYNRRVKPRSFRVGDLVLREVTLATKELNAGKLAPTWEGPYRVIKVVRPSTYKLEMLDGRELPHPWNAEHLKKYYQ